MRNRLPAKSADSSPPVPARISRKTLRWSLASRGNSSCCSSASIAGSRVRMADTSASASSRISTSASNSRLAASSAWARRQSWYSWTSGPSSACSRDNLRYSARSRIASPCASMRSSSSSRPARCSNFSRILSFIRWSVPAGDEYGKRLHQLRSRQRDPLIARAGIAVQAEKRCNEGLQVRVLATGLGQRLGRSMQELVGQPVR